ncbi:MAG: glutamate--tRNA ligase [Calditrichia bacterium]|nr:glutamate--tRNA ligase [Calditrichia bacterium]
MNVYRFAPSPTGFLHVGGARTAIFNWLLAKQTHGKFLVRIEDTDSKRSSAEFTQQIINSLKWLEIDWDDTPLFQSQRKSRYLEIVDRLLAEKNVYHCFCTPEELKQKREIAEKIKGDYVYDKTCLNLSESQVQSRLAEKQEFTIRIKSGAGTLIYHDKIMGEISTEIKLIGDFIIVRSDGNPVYQLAVVVDDHDMGITDVIRGADHLANTPKQILILKALNWNVPQFAHLPLILGPDKKRLSKRHGSTSTEEFKKNGYLPEALFNYLCLLGWASGDDIEIFYREELINKFSLENVNKSNAVFDGQKLKWMNAKYISQMSSDSLLHMSSEFNSEKESMTADEIGSLLKLVDLVKLRAETINDFDKRMNFYYHDPEFYSEKGVKKYFHPKTIQMLQAIMDKLDNEKDFHHDRIENIIRNMAEELKQSAAKLIHPLRLALTGDIASPGIFEIIEILGKNKVNIRINNAIQYIKSNIEISIN